MKPKRGKNPRFEWYPNSIGVDEREWRWRLYARNGEIVASGEGYTTEKDVKRAIGAVKRAVLAITAQESLDGAVKVLSGDGLNSVADAAVSTLAEKNAKFFGSKRRGRAS